MAAQDIHLGGRPAFPEREAFMQDVDSPLRLRMPAGRMEPRERFVADDVDELVLRRGR
jgi:hypothetical protein